MDQYTWVAATAAVGLIMFMAGYLVGWLLGRG